MELDDLKYQLKERLEQSPSDEHSPSDIALLLKKQASSVLDKLHRSLWIEIIFSVLFSVAFIAIALFAGNFVLRVYFGSFILLTAGFGIFQYYLVLKIRKHSLSSLPVKGNLIIIYDLISGYAKRLYWFSMLLLPISLLYSLWLHYIDYNQRQHLPGIPFYAQWQPWVKLLLLLTATAIAMHYLTRWYLHKLYGVYLKQLKKYIAELQPEETF